MGFTFSTHIKSHKTKIKKYDKIDSKCELCEKVFKWEKNLMRHRQNCYPIQSVLSQTTPSTSNGSQEPRYRCHYCDKVYDWLKSRKRHEEKYHHMPGIASLGL